MNTAYCCKSKLIAFVSALLSRRTQCELLTRDCVYVDLALVATRHDRHAFLGDQGAVGLACAMAPDHTEPMAIGKLLP